MKIKSFRFALIAFFCIIILSACDSKKSNSAQETTTQPAKDSTRESQLKEAAPSSYSIAEGHLKVWNAAMAQVLELADSMPESEYGFRPHDSVRTFAGQLVHIATSSKVIANWFLKDQQPPKEHPKMDVAKMSKAEIVKMIKTNLQEVGDTIKNLSNEQLLNEEVKSFSGNTMSRLEGLLLVHDHLTNHKAKANLYIRINNHEPPKYRYY